MKERCRGKEWEIDRHEETESNADRGIEWERERERERERGGRGIETGRKGDRSREWERRLIEIKREKREGYREREEGR